MKNMRVLLFSFFFSGVVTLIAQQKPFPQQLSWPNAIKPNNRTQAQLNKDVSDYYTLWKNKYLKQAATGGYYIAGDCTGPTPKGCKGTSEGHGYGMIITVLMAGFDANAKNYYDGLYQFFDTHRSTGNNELMGWVVDNQESVNAYGSASDGDMDIAYSLILAHYQWGSSGAINYLQEAKDMISKGLKGSVVHTTTKRITLGDWDNNGYNTRSSDWMPSHLQAYADVTDDAFWGEAKLKIYELVDVITANYASVTGLMPDFVVGETPEPASPNFLETIYDGEYYWNASRYPWRIVTDFAHYGSTKAKDAATKITSWIKDATTNDPSKIHPGYYLNGNKIDPTVDWNSLAFISPIVAACIADATNQNYLNAGWDYIRTYSYSYFGDSINMLCMLLISGNWWVPTDAVLSVDGREKQITEIYPNPVINTLCVSQPIDELVLYNALGVEVLRKHSVSNHISLKSLPKGVYTAQLKSRNRVDAIRIIKE